MLFELLPEGNLRWAGTSMCLDVRNGGTGEVILEVQDGVIWYYDVRRFA